MSSQRARQGAATFLSPTQTDRAQRHPRSPPRGAATFALRGWRWIGGWKTPLPDAPPARDFPHPTRGNRTKYALLISLKFWDKRHQFSPEHGRRRHPNRHMKTPDDRSSPESTDPAASVESSGGAHRERRSDALASIHWWKTACATANLPVLMRCFQRVRTWRLPPNWSATDWFEEVKEVLIVATVEAEADFDSTRGIPFGAFLYQRAMARALTRYRQEWNYGTRFHSECAGCCNRDEEEPDALECRSARSGRTVREVPCGSEPDMPLEELAEALADLTEPSRRLIDLLFWHDRTESEAAREFGISQPAICKRLHTVLRSLHRRVAIRK